MKPTSTLARKTKGYGWLPDLPDHRDCLYSAPPLFLRALPPQSDLRPHCPPVYNQGALGSCTANAIAAAVEFDQMRQKLPGIFVPSRLFIYYNERALEGTVGQDSGAQIRDGIKSMARQGDCPETHWPYIVSKFNVKPPLSCYREAVQYRALSYQKVARDLGQMKGCLASGFPFVFGFTVYESFESAQTAKTGVVSMPGSSEQCLGGHAVMAVGYNERRQSFWVRNSWGAAWGLKGYFLMPYAYLLHPGLSSDFWTIRLVA
jgi:C1A family cysteine protease